VKYKKQWYAADSKIAILASGKKAHTERQRCPACVMKQRGLYNAVVAIHDVPKKLQADLGALIEYEAKVAISHNPQNRVLGVLETVDGLEVRVTYPKVARTISRRVQEKYHASEVVSYQATGLTYSSKSDTALKIAEYLNYPDL
jgi:NMD protein affecting ribosome stability and mRNA decay